MMETGVRSSIAKYAVSKDSPWISQFRYGSNPWMARYVYGLMFLVANLLAWVIRDYGQNISADVGRIKNCGDGKDCLGAEGVLRVSFGCFTVQRSGNVFYSSLLISYANAANAAPSDFHMAFFVIMFVTTVGTKKLRDHRDSWHSKWWVAKAVLWIGLTVSPFMLPSPALHIYGIAAHFGAGVFLLIQLVSIICFIKWLNDWCQSDDKAYKCRIHGLLLATASYVIAIAGIILMYIWYAPEPSCFANIFFITWTLVLLQLMTTVSLHPKINAGILTPGLMGLYVVFICWCAIRSEPAEQHCNRKAEESHKTDWFTIISFLVALLAMVIATFSTGIDSQCFQIRKDEPRAEDGVPYGYGFFHFVFATGAMYFAMLLIGWNTNHHPIKKWTIDEGWTSTWVKIVNEWLAFCVYTWMLVAPITMKNRQGG